MARRGRRRTGRPPVVARGHRVRPKQPARPRQPVQVRQSRRKQMRSPQAHRRQHVQPRAGYIFAIGRPLRHAHCRKGSQQAVDSRMLGAQRRREIPTADGLLAASQRLQTFQPGDQAGVGLGRLFGPARSRHLIHAFLPGDRRPVATGAIVAPIYTGCQDHVKDGPAMISGERTWKHSGAAWALLGVRLRRWRRGDTAAV